MNLLLDTHTVIWFLNGDSQISKKAIQYIENPENQNFVSTTSIWEMTIKTSMGKLALTGTLQETQKQFFENGFKLLPISFQHLFTLYELPFYHRDPFDRLIISQAISQDMILVSADQNFKKYNVRLMW